MCGRLFASMGIRFFLVKDEKTQTVRVALKQKNNGLTEEGYEAVTGGTCRSCGFDAPDDG